MGRRTFAKIWVWVFLPLCAIFFTLCAIFPRTMFPDTDPDVQALKWVAGIVWFVWAWFQYIYMKYS